MHPFRAFGDILHKTPWWALITVAVVTVGINMGFLIPRNTLRIDNAGELAGLNKAIQSEIETAYQRETLRALLRAAATVKPDIQEGEIRAAEEAIDELHDIKLSLAEAKVHLEQLQKEGAASEEIANAKSEVDRLRQQSSEVGIRLGQTMERVFSGGPIKAEHLPPKGDDKESIRISIFGDDDGVKPGEAKSVTETKTTVNGKVTEQTRTVRTGTPTVVSRSSDKTVEVLADGTTVLRKPGKIIYLSPDGSTRVERTGDTRTPMSPPAPTSAPTRPSPTGKSGAPSPPVPPTPPLAPVAPVAPSHEPTTLTLGDKVYTIDGGIPQELRDDIQSGVQRDLKRIAIAAAFLPVFIILFLILFIVKFFVGRARAATQLAEVKEHEADFHRMQQQIAQAKLSALQAQVEPHFLYNTLANVQALTEVDPPSANKMVGHLIEYLRAALPKMRESASTIGQEIELARAYLNILQMRMGKRLAFEIDAPADLLTTPFPPLMLPSLVENAIKHGLEPQREGGKISITVSASGGLLTVAVADTGKGLGDGETPAPGGGVGLANLRERLAALYGNVGKFTLAANDPKGSIATLVVPVQIPTIVAAPVANTAARPAAAPTPKSRALAALGSTERAWRTVMSWSFALFVIAAGIGCVAFIVAAYTGALPLNFAGSRLHGAAALPLAIPLAIVMFASLVLVAGLLVAVGYGLGWLALLLVLSIPVLILASLLPALVPFLLVGALLVWWALRVKKQRAARPLSVP